MNKLRSVAIVSQVSNNNVGASISDVLYKSLVLALEEVDFKGVTLDKEALDSVSNDFANAIRMIGAGELTLDVALCHLVNAYESLIYAAQIKASVQAGVLSKETASRLADTTNAKPQKGLNLFSGIKGMASGIKEAFGSAKQEVAPVVKSYGKLDTVHEAVGKTIDVVHTTNNIIIDGTTSIGCGVVNVAAGLAKGGILATGVIAKEANKLGKTIGHKANDGAYEVGKTIADATVRKERNMDLSQIDRF